MRAKGGVAGVGFPNVVVGDGPPTGARTGLTLELTFGEIDESRRPGRVHEHVTVTPERDAVARAFRLGTVLGVERDRVAMTSGTEATLEPVGDGERGFGMQDQISVIVDRCGETARQARKLAIGHGWPRRTRVRDADEPRAELERENPNRITDRTELMIVGEQRNRHAMPAGILLDRCCVTVSLRDRLVGDADGATASPRRTSPAVVQLRRAREAQFRDPQSRRITHREPFAVGKRHRKYDLAVLDCRRSDEPIADRTPGRRTRFAVCTGPHDRDADRCRDDRHGHGSRSDGSHLRSRDPAPRHRRRSRDPRR